MPKKIICFDLDGTLINAQGVIHPADVEILATHRDSLLIPATGRSIGSVRQIFSKNGLFIGQALPFPLVLQNGAALYAEGERVLAHFLFEEEVQAQLINLLLRFPQAGVLLFDLNWIYCLHENGLAKEAIRSLDFQARSFTELSHAFRFSKVMCFADNLDILTAIREALRPLAVGAFQSLPQALEICPQGVNKANGILQLVKLLGVEDYRLYAVGDSENDLPMLELAHTSYAPTTAGDDVIRRVDRAIDASINGILAPIYED
jgi:Cof subfamily protein (haloacid dehalogenase superfamily)